MTDFRLNGWRHDLENYERLTRRLTGIYLLRQFRDHDIVIPDEVDPREWLRVEDQGQIGACQGNALATACEIAYKIATGNKSLQLSRRAAYIWSQRIDGIHGDEGSTLEAGQRVVNEVGLPLESTVPYFDRGYSATIPNEEKAKLEAAQYRIRRSMQCHTYEDVFDFISKGFGAVQIGLAWPNSYMECSGSIDGFSPGRGGHSVAFVGYVKDKDAGGRKRLILANSWGTGWGEGGYATVAPKAVDQMLRHSWTVFIGHTDMTSPVPRKWEFMF